MFSQTGSCLDDSYNEHLLLRRDFTSFRKRVLAPLGATSMAVGKHVTSLEVFLSPLLSSYVAQAGHSLDPTVF